MEKLDLVLLDLQGSKQTDETYNETTYINNKITKERYDNKWRYSNSRWLAIWDR